MNLPARVDVMLMTQNLGPAGGTERQLVEIARSLDRSRYNPHVLCLIDGTRAHELRTAGVPVLHLPMRSFLSPASLVQAGRLARYLRKHRIQIVHAFDYPLICLGVPVARMAGTPIVLSSQRAHRCLTPSYYRPLQRATDRLVDGIIANCQAMRRHLIDEEQLPPALIRLCYNGIDTHRFRVMPRPGLSDRALVIGVIAMLRREKGLDTLVKAFAEVSDGRADLRLVVVGSGAMLPELEALAESLGVAKLCRFEPATADVLSWLRAIDIFVLPSLSEALSNSLMEAMASGCAVVASNVGGNPELVRDGENGLLFQSASAASLASQLRILIQSDALRCRLADAGARTIRDEFSLERSVRQMEDIYQSFLEHSRQREAPSGR